MDDLPNAGSGDLREPPSDGGPREAAFFIKTATAELAVLARTHRLEMLGYLLDMAHLEADEMMRHGKRR